MIFDLSAPVPAATWHDVAVQSAMIEGKSCLRVALSDRAAQGTYGVDYVDQPTFLQLPIDFINGTIEVDILSRLLPDAPDYARGFAGLAYRISPKADHFESVYLRPTNGLRLDPPPPRDRRAIQYFSYPDWKFDRLRNEEPDGPYEAAADIAPDQWINLALEIDRNQLRARVNGALTLDIATTKADPASGGIGLWVDIGTEGFFSNLRIERR
jgi:hypothetical protein